MIKIKINNIEFFVKKNISVLEACRYVGIFIPRFCYHEKLSIAGNCRMCLVDNGIKLVSSCTAVVEDNPQIFTDTPMVKKARENESVAKWLEEKTIVKEIYVPGRIVNIVVK